MTIDEAIDLIRKLQGETPEQLATPIQQSIKLGIEALKVIPRAREGDYASFKLPLPGETEEVK